MKKFLLVLTAASLFICACAPKNDTLFKEAVKLGREGKLSAALKIYNNILKKEPEFFSALINRAIIYEKIGEYKLAEQDYIEALIIDPNRPELLNNVGSFYLSQKRPLLALNYLDRALNITPNYFIALLNRAAANEELGYLNAAAEDLDTALAIAPQNLTVIRNKAVVDYKRFYFEAAINGFTQVLYYNPTDAKTFYARGMAFRLSGKYANALNDFTMAISLDHNYIYALYRRAEMLFKSGDYQAALGDLERLKGINNTFAPAYELTGDIIAIEDPVPAVANYLAAKKLDPANTERYDAKIRLMSTERGRKGIIAKTFLDL